MPASPSGSPSSGRPRSQVRDADRERLVGLLRERYALGGFDLGEFNRRVGLVLAAEYTDDAAAAVADLPQLPGSEAGPPGRVKRPRKRGHAHAAKPGAGWLPTDERFRDPTTRVIMRVWIDPSTQPETRYYVPERE